MNIRLACSLLNAQCSVLLALLIAHCSYCSLLIAHCSLLIAHCSLLLQVLTRPHEREFGSIYEKNYLILWIAEDREEIGT